MSLTQLGDIKDLWAVASVILGFQLAAFAWRMTREMMFSEGARRFPPCEYLNVVSLFISIVGVFTLPTLFPASFSRASLGFFGCSAIFFGFYPFAVAAHYKLLFRLHGESVPFCSLLEGVTVGLAVLAVVAFALSYGWKEKTARAELESQSKMLEVKPDFNGLSPAEAYVFDDVSYAILFPVKADQIEKADAREWYRSSWCAAVGDPALVNSVVHDHGIFAFESYDDRWLKAVNLPKEVKHALWNAKIRECQLPVGSKRVKACLNRQTGSVALDPFSDYGGQLVSCGPNQEMVYLNSDSEPRTD